MTENIDERDKKEVQKIHKRLNSSIDTILSNLEYLSTLLKEYKALIDNAVTSNIEYIDIINKYLETPSTGTYNLPGVFASTMGNFDIDEARKDNERLKSVKDEKESIENKRNIDFQMIVQTYSDVKSKFNLMASDNQQIFSYLNSLQKNI